MRRFLIIKCDVLDAEIHKYLKQGLIEKTICLDALERPVIETLSGLQIDCIFLKKNPGFLIFCIDPSVFVCGKPYRLIQSHLLDFGSQQSLNCTQILGKVPKISTAVC